MHKNIVWSIVEDEYKTYGDLRTQWIFADDVKRNDVIVISLAWDRPEEKVAIREQLKAYLLKEKVDQYYMAFSANLRRIKDGEVLAEEEVLGVCDFKKGKPPVVEVKTVKRLQKGVQFSERKLFVDGEVKELYMFWNIWNEIYINLDKSLEGKNGGEKENKEQEG